LGIFTLLISHKNSKTGGESILTSSSQPPHRKKKQTQTGKHKDEENILKKMNALVLIQDLFALIDKLGLLIKFLKENLPNFSYCFNIVKSFLICKKRQWEQAT